MTGIGGPSGVGPKGPGGIDPAGSNDASSDISEGTEAARSDPASGSSASAQAERSGAAAGLHSMDALAAEIAAGRLTPRQAIDYLVDAAGAQLDPADRVEFRDMLTDLFANDPHLRSLITNLGGQ
jgi:uncharacterized membrane protein